MAPTKKSPAKSSVNLKHSSAVVIAIDGPKGTRTCANPNCNTIFVPKRIHQVFCNRNGPGSCRKAYFKLMQDRHSHACPLCGSIHRPKDPSSPGLLLNR